MTQAKDSSIPSLGSFNLSQMSNIGGSGTMTGLLAELETLTNPAVSQPAAVTESTQGDDEEDEEAD